MTPQDTIPHASKPEPIAHGDLYVLNPPTPRGGTAKRDNAGALEIKNKDEKFKSVLENLDYFNGEGIKDLLKTSGIISKGFELLQDVARSLPTPTFISTHELGEDMKDINSTQKALAYFLQTTSGVKNRVYDHVGAVGCDVDEDELQKARIINFRLAKNRGLTEEDIEFMKTLKDLMNGTTSLANVELLALKHIAARVLHEVELECQGLQSLLRHLATHSGADQPFGEDSLQVLNWLVRLHKAKEPPQRSDGQRKANPLKRAREYTDQITEEDAIHPQVTHESIPGLRQASEASCRLFDRRGCEQAEADIRGEIRGFLKLTGTRRKLLDPTTQKLTRCFYSILGIIAEPLINLKTISKFLLEHRQKCLPMSISVEFHPIAAPCSPEVPTTHGPTLRLMHCEMQILDYYILQRRPKNGGQAMKSRIDSFKQHLGGFTDVLEAWEQLSEAELKRPGVEGGAGPSKRGKSLAR
ncbi:hypothetical protein JMJ77_0006327 [Colletotrichum scovillei]|uniref:Uncharacterized protein n=1 Tax=Colletotrichum scovillei TaxID=1209932 RepID=A0A9P7UL35_9PEZI|nr:hypothetical protein JMJ77_0006327 [Colletotrichum scovillei]KAG7084666.1 hypothetical protein JMJ78_0010099 [Colletotrichum scovillei]